MTSVQVSFIFIRMSQMPRVIPIPDLSPEQRIRRQRCAAANCDQPTHERKPYCADHVELHVHAQFVLGEIAIREQEQADVARRGWRAVNLTGTTAADVLLELRLRGKRTTPRLSRDLVLPEPVVAAYVDAFARQGWVLLGETARGIRLVCPEALPSAQELAASRLSTPAERKTPERKKRASLRRSARAKNLRGTAESAA